MSQAGDGSAGFGIARAGAQDGEVTVVAAQQGFRHGGYAVLVGEAHVILLEMPAGLSGSERERGGGIDCGRIGQVRRQVRECGGEIEPGGGAAVVGAVLVEQPAVGVEVAGVGPDFDVGAQVFLCRRGAVGSHHGDVGHTVGHREVEVLDEDAVKPDDSTRRILDAYGEHGCHIFAVPQELRYPRRVTLQRLAEALCGPGEAVGGNCGAGSVGNGATRPG